MGKDTTVEFSFEGDVWPIVEKWAAENGYKQKESTEQERTFQKGTGFLVAPMMLQMKSEGGKITLKAWIRVNIIIRALALFLVPSLMGIESGGIRLAVPRKIARKAVNKLLADLNQKPIE